MPWIARVLLLIVGVQLSLIVGGGAWPPHVRVMYALTASLGAAILLSFVLPRWRNRLPHAIPWTAIVFVAATAFLYWIARAQARSFTLKYQDEFSYAIGAQMLARGRLWMSAHPLGEFFESFQILTDPVYASIYFPGAAMMFALGVWTHAPTWLVPLLLSGGLTAIFFLVLRQLFGLRLAFVGAAMLLSLSNFRLQSIMLLAGVPAVFLGLLATFAWLRWRRSRQLRWAVVIGGALGWAAITRPIDGLCFAIPIAVAMSCSIVNKRSRGNLVGAVVATAVALPFVGVQLVFNRGVTGSFTTTPFSLYAEKFYPGSQYGFGRGAATPQTSLPQKLAYYENDVRPLVQQHTPTAAARSWATDRFGETLTYAVPHAIVLILLPIGVYAVVSSRRRMGRLLVVTAPAVLFPILYWPYVFFLPHYTLVAAPAVITLILAGVRLPEKSPLPSAARRATAAFFTIALLAVSVVELPIIQRANADEFFPATGLQAIDRALADIPPGERAIVLFRFPRDGNPHEEPVYNAATAWPDDARIIRAHDLGDRNRKLFDYYARLQPDRSVWAFDRGGAVSATNPRRLGLVSDLARSPIIEE